MTTTEDRFELEMRAVLEDLVYQTFTDIGAFHVAAGFFFGTMWKMFGDLPLIVMLLIYVSSMGGGVFVRTMGQPPYPEPPKVATILLLPIVLVAPAMWLTVHLLSWLAS